MFKARVARRLPCVFLSATEFFVHSRSSFREDTMSRWWMPRRCVPMKDVA